MDLVAAPLAVRSVYRESAVPLPLGLQFLCSWRQEIFGSGKYQHRVLPDACVDIVFVNDDLPIVVGPCTKPFVAQLAASTRILGVRLNPGYTYSLFGIPATELLNRSVPLTEVSRASSARFAAVLQMTKAGSRTADFFETLARVVELGLDPDPAVLAAVRWLASHPNSRVEQLSQQAGISYRQLRRRFSAAIGYPPKMFQSVLRFQRFLNFVGNSPKQPLADIAAAAGYADQAHMTREVRRFANCTPTALPPSVASTLRLSGFFKTDRTFPD